MHNRRGRGAVCDHRWCRSGRRLLRWADGVGAGWGRAARGQVAWAIWQPVTRAKLAVWGRWRRSLNQSPATSSTTAAAGEVAYIPAFWSQAEVSQSAARAAGRLPPMTQPKKRGPAESMMPPSTALTRWLMTSVGSCPESSRGSERFFLRVARSAVAATEDD